jgi:hypothetical protein
MPTTWKPRSASRAWSASSFGIAVRHGGHQVAQKSSSVTRPSNVSEATALPSRLSTTKAGSGRGKTGGT